MVRVTASRSASRPMSSWPPSPSAAARTAAGGPESGPIGELPLRERWSWLVAPRSTILQTWAPHVGLCQTPASALDRLLTRYVRIAP